MVALVFGAACVLALGQGLRHVVDSGFGSGDPRLLDQALAAMIAVVALYAAATWTRFYFMMSVGERVVTDLRRAVFDHLLGLDWKRDPSLRAGLNWLSVHWSVSENPGPTELPKTEPKTELYYFLYAVERLGMLSGLDKIGGRLWYSEGAKAILEAQKKDGSWDDGAERSTSTWDTCFAILFLKKATRPMVASGASR